MFAIENSFDVLMGFEVAIFDHRFVYVSDRPIYCPWTASFVLGLLRRPYISGYISVCFDIWKKYHYACDMRRRFILLITYENMAADSDLNCQFSDFIVIEWYKKWVNCKFYNQSGWYYLYTYQ